MSEGHLPEDPEHNGYTLDEIRARIEECRRDLARAEGESKSLAGEVEATRTKIQTTLGCKPGKERAAVKKLRAEIDKDAAKLDELIETIEAAQGSDE